MDVDEAWREGQAAQVDFFGTRGIEVAADADDAVAIESNISDDGGTTCAVVNGSAAQHALCAVRLRAPGFALLQQQTHAGRGQSAHEVAPLHDGSFLRRVRVSLRVPTAALFAALLPPRRTRRAGVSLCASLGPAT